MEIPDGTPVTAVCGGGFPFTSGKGKACYRVNFIINDDKGRFLKVDKVLYKKGLMNVKYVYGSITYTEAKKDKTISFVAPYYLVYDSSKGYNWKLDRVVGEDSPNYKTYTQ
jgi:hypothetical protein